MRNYLLLIILSLTLIACATQQPAPTSNNVTFFVQTKTSSPEKVLSKDKQWNLIAEINRSEKRPKTNYYNFKINSSSNTFTIRDINYKYGNYGKWRLINKTKYLPAPSEPTLSSVIEDFPITIKKNGEPHQQLLRVTLDSNNKTKYINFVFGVHNCLAKKEKEFVCF